jgi:hypothetical protein
MLPHFPDRIANDLSNNTVPYPRKYKSDGCSVYGDHLEGNILSFYVTNIGAEDSSRMRGSVTCLIACKSSHNW